MGSNDHFFQLYIIYIHLSLRKEIRLPLNELTALFMYPDPGY